MGSKSICSTSFSCLSFNLLPSSSSPESPSIKLHRSSDFAYFAIRSTTFHRKSDLTFCGFHLLRRIDVDDIGTIYLYCLCNSADMDFDEDSACFYTMKLMGKEAVALKNKLQRAKMERKILKMLDHTFLPTLYAEFEASYFRKFEDHSRSSICSHHQLNINQKKVYA